MVAKNKKKEQPNFSIFDKSDSKDHKCILYVIVYLVEMMIFFH